MLGLRYNLQLKQFAPAGGPRAARGCSISQNRSPQGIEEYQDTQRITHVCPPGRGWAFTSQQIKICQARHRAW